MKIRAYIIAIFLFVFACKTVEEPTLIGQDYFPVNVGDYWVYEMDSISFDAFNEVSDTLHYFIREEIANTFYDVRDSLSYAVDVYYKLDSADNWTFKRTEVSNRNLYRAERVEEDHRFVKLVFPVKDKKSWDGNQLNIHEPLFYRFRNVASPKTVAGINYPNVLMVEQEDDSNFFQRKLSLEYYAYQVGLIKKEFISTEEQFGVLAGSKYTKTLIEAGN